MMDFNVNVLFSQARLKHRYRVSGSPALVLYHADVLTAQAQATVCRYCLKVRKKWSQPLDLTSHTLVHMYVVNQRAKQVHRISQLEKNRDRGSFPLTLMVHDATSSY